MEEISWRQRVFGHRPPEYFLAQNYQQELNVHNLASMRLRRLTFRAIILAYLVLLPLGALIPFVGCPKRVHVRKMLQVVGAELHACLVLCANLEKNRLNPLSRPLFEAYVIQAKQA